MSYMTATDAERPTPPGKPPDPQTRKRPRAGSPPGTLKGHRRTADDRPKDTKKAQVGGSAKRRKSAATSAPPRGFGRAHGEEVIVTCRRCNAVGTGWIIDNRIVEVDAFRVSGCATPAERLDQLTRFRHAAKNRNEVDPVGAPLHDIEIKRGEPVKTYVAQLQAEFDRAVAEAAGEQRHMPYCGGTLKVTR